MARFLKYVLWLAIAGGVIYGGYYAYENWWNAGTADKLSSGAEAISTTASKKVGDYAKTIASSTQQAATSFIKSKIGDFVSVIGEQILSAGLNLSGATSSLPVSSPIQSVINLPAGNLPAPTSSAFDAPPPPATILIGMNQPLSFSVNSGQVYKVDWGDGVKSQGATETDSITIIHHSWSSFGDYTVKVSVGNSVSSNVYSFPVRVYPPHN